MTEYRKLKVFLCHSKDDKPMVRELYRRLVASGFEAWLDEEKLLPGQDWDLEIRKAVRESDAVVVCLSNSSTTKAGYVQKEIRFALDVADEQPEGAVFLIPARLEDCKVPMRLSKWQWVDLFYSKGYERLESSLELGATKLGISKRSIRFLEPQMIKIPQGPFVIGIDINQANDLNRYGASKEWLLREQPQHLVTLSEYFIGKYPVTNHEYQFFIKDIGYKSPDDWDGSQYQLEKRNYPVRNIAWEDAVAFCEWLSEKSSKDYHLPSEAQWEKAARGTDSRIYPWGNKFDPKFANTADIDLNDTTPVGYYSPDGDSYYGCSDMIGNVWEWCLDVFDETAYRKQLSAVLIDPVWQFGGNRRVLRGGSFGYLSSGARCTIRTGLNSKDMANDTGFRVALSLPSK